MRKIQIHAADVTAAAVLDGGATADAVWKALPLEGRANTWGDEIYFAVPLELDLAADARDVVEMGELGYWPTGNAFCIFFGPTHPRQPGRRDPGGQRGERLRPRRGGRQGIHPGCGRYTGAH